MLKIEILNNTKYMQSRDDEKIQYIILHYSASTYSSEGSAQLTINTLNNRKSSSDYAVDDVRIVQFAKDPTKWASKAIQSLDADERKYGTTAGKKASNKNSISIEMSSIMGSGKYEANNPTFRFSEEVLKNTADLCRMLISKYEIPKDHVIRHYDIVGKLCPGIIGWNPGAGSNDESTYKAFVDSLYDDTVPTSVPSESDVVYADTSTSTSSSTSSDTSEPDQSSNEIPFISNNVMRLAYVSKSNTRGLKEDDARKKQFEALRNTMTDDAPDMGRDILLTAELYDSNILKGTQESREERG